MAAAAGTALQASAAEGPPGPRARPLDQDDRRSQEARGDPERSDDDEHGVHDATFSSGWHTGESGRVGSLRPRAGPPSTYLYDIENAIVAEIEVSAPATLATARRLPFAIGLATVME
jgi:hypothetical protein